MHSTNRHDDLLEQAREITLHELDVLMARKEKSVDSYKLIRTLSGRKAVQSLQEERLGLMQEAYEAAYNATTFEALEDALINYLSKNVTLTREKIQFDKDVLPSDMAEKFGKFHNRIAELFPNILPFVVEKTKVPINFLVNDNVLLAIRKQLQFKRDHIQNLAKKYDIALSPEEKHEVTRRWPASSVALDNLGAAGLFKLLNRVDQIGFALTAKIEKLPAPSESKQSVPPSSPSVISSRQPLLQPFDGVESQSPVNKQKASRYHSFSSKASSSTNREEAGDGYHQFQDSPSHKRK